MKLGSRTEKMNICTFFHVPGTARYFKNRCLQVEANRPMTVTGERWGEIQEAVRQCSFEVYAICPNISDFSQNNDRNIIYMSARIL